MAPSFTTETPPRARCRPGAATYAALLVIALCGLVPNGRADSSAKLASGRDTFQTALQSILTDYAQRERTWPDQYRRALRALHSRMQSGGRLDGLVAVSNELARFELTNDVPAAALVDRPPELLALQNNYRDTVARAQRERDQSIVSLAQRYADSLVALQRSLTKANQISEALAVKQEITNLRNNATVTAAEFAQAIHEVTRLEEEAAPHPPKAPSPRTDD